MRTTINLPDSVSRQAKARVALEGLTLKELITSYVVQGLQPCRRSTPPMMAKAATGRPIPALSGDKLAELEIQENIEKYERSTRR